MIFNKPIVTLYCEPKVTVLRGGCVYSTIADEGLYGQSADVLEYRGDYAKVRTFYGYTGWARRTDLTESAPDGRLFYVAALFLDVLAAPSVEGLPLLTVPRASVLTVTGEADENCGYAEVTLLDGNTGFVRRDRLTPFITSPVCCEGELRRRICETARSYIGAQYRWGGKTPAGVDCSGLCSVSYLLNGVIIYRDAKMMDNFPVREIGRADIKPADLLYFKGHIAMYLGDGLFIHSTVNERESGVVVNAYSAQRADEYFYPKELLDSMTAAGSIFK